MKFEEKTSDVTQVGDIKNNGVSIDTANIDFIVTILSTSLYSNPIQSFLRETVSNAWDSHIEAKVDSPVVLELGTDTEGKEFCRVQDFGVGLSEERFDAVYRNIGSSTKRDSNSQIGGFGIGRFSALSYSDTVNITSNFDGTKYQYLMYKDGNKVAIDLLHSGPTKETNGVEVLVYLKTNDYYSFKEAIKDQLCYFENLHIVDSIGDLGESFSDFKIKEYTNFKVNNLTTDREVSILLGKVKYPLRFDSLTQTYTYSQQRYPLSLKFEIGDLEVTPNREEILYSTDNITKIEAKIKKVLEEIETLGKISSKKDFSNLLAYKEAISEENRLYLIEENAYPSIAISNNLRDYTLNGVTYDENVFTKVYNTLERHRFMTSTHYIDSNSIRQNRYSVEILKIKDIFGSMIFCDIPRLKGVTKEFLRDKYDSHYCFNHLDTKEIYKESIEVLYSDLSYPRKATKNIHKLIFKYFLSNLIKIPKVNNSTVTKSWLAERALRLAEKRKHRTRNTVSITEAIHIHVARKSHVGYRKVVFDSKTKTYGELRKIKKLTVYSVKSDTKLKDLYFALGHKINVIAVASNKLKYLKDIPNFIKIEDFMDVKYKVVRNVGTAVLIDKTLPKLDEINRISNLSEVSEYLAQTIKTLHQFKQQYLQRDKCLLTEDVYQLCVDKNYFNEEVRGILNSNITILKNSECLTLFTEEANYSYSSSIPKKRINLVVDYILARKLFRPNLKSVFKLKTETIYNLIPETDENNEN